MTTYYSIDEVITAIDTLWPTIKGNYLVRVDGLVETDGRGGVIPGSEIVNSDPVPQLWPEQGPPFNLDAIRTKCSELRGEAGDNDGI